MKDSVLILLVSFVVVSSLVFFGGVIGYRYNEARWRSLISPEMYKTCQECEEIGENKGEKKGYIKGVTTCDDVIDGINNQGRR